MKRFLPLLGILCVSITVSAQQPTPSPIKSAEQRPCCVHRITKRAPRPTTTIRSAQAIPTATDFFVGEAKVDVAKDETVVRLAMAQHGSVLIELPANDGPRYIIPGDPEMATVDEKALEKNKRAIVVRPGSLFVTPPAHRQAHSPAATVTVQMRSGLVVTFLFYPVEDLAQNVHRCVLTYNRDEVVARRRAAGLPVNLDTTNNTPERRIDTGQSAAPISISVETTDELKPSAKEGLEKASSGPNQVANDTKPKPEDVDKSVAIGNSETPNNSDKAHERQTEIAKAGLLEATKKPSRFKNWTKPLHGLSLSVVQQNDPKNDFQVVIVGVRNTSPDSLKLTSGSPDLLIEMFDEKGKPLNIESIKKLHTEVNDLSGAIPSKATVYYAIAYAPPVLGVNQQLKVVVGQSNAADEPASIKLTNGGR